MAISVLLSHLMFHRRWVNGGLCGIHFGTGEPAFPVGLQIGLRRRHKDWASAKVRVNIAPFKHGP